MKKHFNLLFISCSFLLSLSACQKQVRSQDGSNSVVYSRNYSDHYKIGTASMVQNETFVIGDVNVYQDAMGQVAYSAFNGATDGKPDWVKNATISNIKLSEYVTINLTDDNSKLKSNLVNCQLFFMYYPMDNSGKKKVLLANFVEYNSSKDEVILQPTGEDLTKLFKNEVFGGQLVLKIMFAQTPHDVGTLRLWYSIPFNFNYSFQSKESGKKE